MFKIILITSLSLYFASFSVLAQNTSQKKYYVITDSQGRNVYTDRPPIESPQSARELDIRVSTPRDNGVSVEEEDDSSLPFDVDENIDSDWEDAGPGEKFAPNRSAACEASSRNYAVLSDSSRPAMKMDENNNPVLLDEQERKVELDRAQADIDSYCN